MSEGELVLSARTAGELAKAMSRFERDVRFVEGRLSEGWESAFVWVVRVSQGQGGSITAEGLPCGGGRGDGGVELSLLLSIEAVAGLLDSSESTVKRMVSDGIFSRVKVGARTKLVRAEVEAFIAGQLGGAA